MAVMGSDRARETVRRLEAAVTSGRWPVNGRIPTEDALAAEFGVGRSTIREAVRSLAHLGMLEPAPGRGTFVRSLHPVRGLLSNFAATHSAADVLSVRAALEVQAAQLAAQRRDAEHIAQLHEVHDADVAGTDDAERGSSPGHFHALLVAASGNALLIELYDALAAAVRTGIAEGTIGSPLDAETRHAEHAALLAAIAAGNAAAAGTLAATHAEHDLVAGPRLRLAEGSRGQY